MLKINSFSLMLSILVSAFANGVEFDELKLKNWHQWRGPHADGVAVSGNAPVSWGEGENIKWKVPVAGRGTSSPIVWENKIFLLTTIDTGEIDPNLPKPKDQPKRPFGITFPNSIHQFVVLCLDRQTGNEIWRRVATEKIPHQGHHGDNDFASASPTTDGKHLYAWFGSAGLFCYDLKGNRKWERDLGEVDTRLSFGEGSSPVVHQDRIVLVRDNEGASQIAVFDKNSGKTLWTKERDEPSTWATPLIVESEGKTQIVTNGKNRVRSYNLQNGDLIWECGGQVSNVTPSPVLLGDTVFCMSGYRGSALFALPVNSTGDITDSDKIKWQLGRGTPYVPSPVLYKGRLYFNQSNNAILTCIDAKSGNILINRTRLPKIQRIYASPVACDGRIYFTGREGTTLVIKDGTEYELIATNQLNDGFDSSPAIAGNQMFLRGQSNLYCIQEQ